MMRALIRGRWRPLNGVKVPLLLQYSETECGLSALAMIFAYFRHFPAKETLRQLCGSSRDGARANTLLAIAKSHGFETKAYRASLSDLKALTIPVIAFVNQCHYLVLAGFGHDKVFINDPATGYRVLSIADFRALYSGIIFTFKPGPSFQAQANQVRLSKLLIRSLVAFRSLFLFMLLTLLLLIMEPISQSVLTTLSTRQLMTTEFDQAFFWLFVIVLCSVLLTLCQLTNHWQQFKLSLLLSLKKSYDLLDHLLNLPMRYYAIRRKSELSLLLSQCRQVAEILSKESLTLLVNSVAALSSLSLIFFINSRLCLSVIFFSACSLTLTYLAARHNQLLQQASLKQLGNFYSHIISGLRLKDSIVTAGLEQHNSMQFSKTVDEKLAVYQAIQTLFARLGSLQLGIQQLSYYSLLCLGILELNQARVSLGHLLAVFGLQGLFQSSLASLQPAISSLQTAMATQLRIEDCMQSQLDPRMQMSTVMHGQLLEQGDLHADAVSFYYNPSQPPVLSDINLHIKPGQHIAIVGATGSGKSTLAKCLAGLYLCDRGSIQIGKQNLATLPPSQLSQLVAYVEQNTQLFSGSIIDSLLMAQKTSDSHDLQAILRCCVLDQVIEQHGLTHRLDEHSSSLSGGEKQRLDIAAALLQDTPLLILDEATSALDEATEYELIQNLRQLNKTVIFIAHRLSAIAHCDQLLVMHHGMIVERGRHDELLAKQGHYHRLFTHQVEDA